MSGLIEAEDPGLYHKPSGRSWEHNLAGIAAPRLGSSDLKNTDLVATTATFDSVQHMGSGCLHGVAACSVEQEMSGTLEVVNAEPIYGTCIQSNRRKATVNASIKLAIPELRIRFAAEGLPVYDEEWDSILRSREALESFRELLKNKGYAYPSARLSLPVDVEFPSDDERAFMDGLRQRLRISSFTTRID